MKSNLLASQRLGQEVRLFCDNLRTADRSLLEFLEADYTFANAELARHYGLAKIPAKGFEIVSARGKWILDVLLGSPPPPSPADAGNFAPPAKDRREPASFREKLAQRASDRNCMGCHLKIDPLGFALENYDAIGRWRDKVGDMPVDNVGTLPGVGKFQGVAGLRTGGLHGLRMRSQDGLTWTDRVVGEEGEHINSMLFDGKQFVGIGQGATYRSPGGQEWERTPDKDAPTVATFGDGVYVGALWPGKVLSSEDGIRWEKVHELPHNVLAIAHGRIGKT